MLVIHRHAKRTAENLAAIDIALTLDETAEVIKVLEEHPVIGDRYFGEGTGGNIWG